VVVVSGLCAVGEEMTRSVGDCSLAVVSGPCAVGEEMTRSVGDCSLAVVSGPCAVGEGRWVIVLGYGQWSVCGR